MIGEFSYPDSPVEQGLADGGEQPLDIVGILFDYFNGQKMEWADRPEKVKAILGEEAEVIGNTLLNTNKPLTLEELATQTGLSKQEADDACMMVRLLIKDPAPLEFVAVADHQMQVSRYQIVPTLPKAL